MTEQTPGCGSNSEARKRVEEGRALASQREDLIAGGADPADLMVPLSIVHGPGEHEGCRVGQYRADDQWRTVSCAGGGGDVGALTADVVCMNCDADDLGCTACGAHGALAARSQRPEGAAGDLPRNPACAVPGAHAEHHLGGSITEGRCKGAAQRPEGVTVTEWGVREPGGQVYGNCTEAQAKKYARVGEKVVSRQRTTFPDVVTEWAEVSGDTEAGGDRG